MELFWHTPKRKKNRLEREDIHVIRENVTRRVGLVLLSFRLKDLILRLEIQGNKESLNVQTRKKEETSEQDKRTFLLPDNKDSS